MDFGWIQARDLSIAYGLVAATYLGIGITFYVTFPLEKACIEDVCNSNRHLYLLIEILLSGCRTC